MITRIVTDSTADLPPEVAERLGITVVPLSVHFGEEELLDGVDLSSEQFFRRLPGEESTPTTSQPPVGAFRDVYRELTADGSEVISIHVSGKLSGTLASARQGAAEVGGSRVHVIDSATVTMALGMAVESAAEAASEGTPFEDVIAAVEGQLSRTHLFFVLDTLEYLRRGGRIGRGQELVGTLLKVKPILTIADGEVLALGRTRTKPKAITDLLNRVAALGAIERGGVVHATTPDDCDALAERLRALAPDVPVGTGMIGPVVGVHAGPGLLGIAVVVSA